MKKKGIMAMNKIHRYILAAIALVCLTRQSVFTAEVPTNGIRIANVLDFGAKGDGKTDDTAAIDKAWAFVMDAKKPQANFKFAASVNTTLYFPPGVYRYSGKGLMAGNNGMQSWHVKGDGMNDVRIEITSDVYFITCGMVVSTVIEGISFVGGKGVFKSVHTGNMVGGKHIFRDCYFFDYTECAIGNNANDSPYLVVADCIFHCRDGAQAIGVAWGGYGDDSQITRSHFEQNAYHLKLGDRAMGSSFQVGPRNSFFCWGGTKTKADIWIVPNENESVNCGPGCIIAENKFGNENIDDTRPRILIAAEDKTRGSDRQTWMPDEKNASPKQWVTGWRIRDNLFGGGGEPKKGVVYSCIPNAKIIFDHNYYFGSAYPWLIEFAPDVKRIPVSDAGAFVYAQERNAHNYPAQKVCNLPGYAVPFDPYAIFLGNPEVPSAWQRDNDPGYEPLVSLTGAQMPTIGTTKVTAVEDAHGGRNAVLVEFAQEGDALSLRLDHKYLREGKVGFIEVELKKAEQKPVSNLQVWIVRGNPYDYDRVCSRILDPQEGWQRITIPFVISKAEGDISF
ncbi:MAG TPA: glycosyl hydrolase family 28-related protein, partial [Verrucomicrobiota bacterium]|nr:glycosyl hydrolase family 28-related protein [Verrucomicrobiota bacterium]